MPSLYYNSANPRNTAYTIRGLGSNTLSISAANDGIEPGVGFYVDQVYHGRPATARSTSPTSSAWKCCAARRARCSARTRRRAPSTSSAAQPTFEPEANAEVSFGDYDFVQAKGSVSGPLFGDVVAGRLSAQITQRDGLIHNVTNRRGAERARQLRGARAAAVRAERESRAATDRRRLRSRLGLLHSELPARRPEPAQSARQFPALAADSATSRRAATSMTA